MAREHWPLPLLSKFFCALIFLNARQDFGEKIKKTKFSAKIVTSLYGPSLPKYRDIFKILTDDRPNILSLLGIAKTLLTNLHWFLSYLKTPFFLPLGPQRLICVSLK